MILEINTEDKTIKVKGKVPLSELVEKLKDIFGDTWAEYSLESTQEPFMAYPSYPVYPTHLDFPNNGPYYQDFTTTRNDSLENQGLGVNYVTGDLIQKN